MPKAASKTNNCGDCKKSLSVLHHECVRHSLCVDAQSGLWDPSICAACENLFTLASNEEDHNNKHKLIKIATRIKAKVTKRCNYATDIFADDFIRLKYSDLLWLKVASRLPKAPFKFLKNE